MKILTRGEEWGVRSMAVQWHRFFHQWGGGPHDPYIISRSIVSCQIFIMICQILSDFYVDLLVFTCPKLINLILYLFIRGNKR